MSETPTRPCLRIWSVWLEQPTARMQETGRANIRIVTSDGVWRREVPLDEDGLRQAREMAERYAVDFIIACELASWCDELSLCHHCQRPVSEIDKPNRHTLRLHKECADLWESDHAKEANDG